MVLLLSSSGMGRYTARATQLAKMARRMMISNGLEGKTQEIHRSIETPIENLLGVNQTQLPTL